MSWNRIVALAALVAPVGTAACAGGRIPPRALVDARTDFSQVRDGIAARLAPAEVHEADIALQRAERAWERAPGEAMTVDLAIVADRKALRAQAVAQTIYSQQDTQASHAQLEVWKTQQLQSAQAPQARRTLGMTEMQLPQQPEAGVGIAVPPGK